MLVQTLCIVGLRLGLPRDMVFRHLFISYGAIIHADGCSLYKVFEFSFLSVFIIYFHYSSSRWHKCNCELEP